MALFGNDKPAWKADEEEKLNFFSTSEAEYKIPGSRKPVVLKKDKATNKVVEKKKSTGRKTDTAKKSVKASVAVGVKKSEAVKKTAAAKPAVKKSEPKKAAPKTSETKLESKKLETKKAEAKNTAPTVKKNAEKKAATKAQATKKVAAKRVVPKSAVKEYDIETAETVTEVKTARNGSFDIKKSKDGRFVFNLYSANRVIIATSQVYSSSQSAMTGIKSVMANALKAEIEDLSLKKPVPKAYPKWEIYIDKAGEYRFRLNASNANCICHAKAGYANKSNCKRGIESIIRLAEDADVKKVYISKK